MRTLKFAILFLVFLLPFVTGYLLYTPAPTSEVFTPCQQSFRVLPAQITNIHIYRVSDNQYIGYCTTDAFGYCPQNSATLTEGVEYRAVPDCGSFIDGYHFIACTGTWFTVYCD
jgi:hypothetical protein